MSPSRKRPTADDLQEQFSVSERRACGVLEQPRSTQRYESKPRDDEPALLAVGPNEVRIEVHHDVVLVDERSDELIPKAEVQGQA